MEEPCNCDDKATLKEKKERKSQIWKPKQMIKRKAITTKNFWNDLKTNELFLNK